ncbi:hypothetical protein J2W34_006526 [Variovorax boronicumulans]|nr:hypothetical protein [Variovorax boronicumulans]MDQ0074700.1 hypothetical protein [Variovorax boronicumulans]
MFLIVFTLAQQVEVPLLADYSSWSASVKVAFEAEATVQLPQAQR